ncbi:MAG: glutathione S-transferase family protein [Betaproteobacteria bacterium]|nr:glutathione S-transferase family protein [Betaproteobacteria bacterium]
MFELYHCIDARSFRPLWTLEELGLPYRLNMLGFPPRVLHKSYRGINPLGTIPLLLDGESRLTESAAICQYLAARHSPRNMNVEADEPGFADYLNYLHFGEATLTFPQTLVLRYRQFEPPERLQRQVAEDYEKWFLARLRNLDSHLGRRQWLSSERFTAADISVGYALLLARHLGLGGQMSPVVDAYWQRLESRPAFLRAQQAQQRAAAEQGIPPIPAPLTGRTG